MESGNMFFDVFPKEHASRFAAILGDAVTSYIENKGNSTPSEWLNNYLMDNLTEASKEDASRIAKEIVGTITRHGAERQSLSEHIASGKSVESWFVKGLNAAELSPGEQAHKLAECDIALDEVSTQYTESDGKKSVTIDSVPTEYWDDENWNPYKLKDVVSQTVKQAGAVALESLVSGLVEQVTGYSMQISPGNMGLGEDILTEETDEGLKTAIAGAMEIAASEGILPMETSTGTRSVLASVAIDNVKILHRVVSGKLTLAEGLSEMQTQSIATVYSMIGMEVGTSIGASIGTVFGPVGSAMGAFVGGTVGELAGSKIGLKILEVGNKFSIAARSTLKKVGGSIKNGLQKILNLS